MLAEHGQYLPFDPLLAEADATLGGTVAAGLSGPGRYRYGGVRDFVLGVRFVDGMGNVVRGGGKVVKNAAGFDFPKLMVGSMGRLGVLAELSFKVFPQPQAFATAVVSYQEPLAAQVDVQRLARQPLDIEAIDVAVDGDSVRLYVRIGGLAELLPARIDRLCALLRPDGGGLHAINGEDETEFWRRSREFAWAPAELPLVKVPCTATRMDDLTKRLVTQLEPYEADQLHVRFSVAGNVAWIAWPAALRDDSRSLDARLAATNLPGLALRGVTGSPHIGAQPTQYNQFYGRIKSVLDPQNRFGS